MTQEPYGYKQSLCNWSLEEIRGLWNRYAKLRETDDDHLIGIALFKQITTKTQIAGSDKIFEDFEKEDTNRLNI